MRAWRQWALRSSVASPSLPPSRYFGASRARHVIERYTIGMRTTIDKAGRVVIPAQIRERSGLTPGSELEVIEDESGIRLQRVAPGPRLVRVGRRLVARPTVPADARAAVDIAALIEDERNRWP